MREYETLFIVQPEISEEGSAAILAKLDEELTKDGSQRLMCEDLGKRKLAYEIEKFHKGHYHILHYLDEGQVVAKLERILRLEESILRFMTIVVEDAVVDIETRVVRAKEEEEDQRRRAEERAAREAEEAKAREEAERIRAEEEVKEAAEAAAAAEAGAAAAAAAAEEGAEAASADDDTAGESAAEEAAAPAAEDGEES